MKPLLELVKEDKDSSIWVERWESPGYNFQWHYHSEFELTYVRNCHGRRFVGDHIAEIHGDDLVLLGESVPHTWFSEANKTNGTCEAIVIKFDASLPYLDKRLPELKKVHNLLNRSSRGLHFKGKTLTTATYLMQAMSKAQGLQRMLLFIELLELLAEDEAASYITSERYNNLSSLKDPQKIDKILSYLNEHYAEEVRLENMASLAAMSETSFSRYFKRTTGKTLSNYLCALRVGNACRLLRETEMSVSEIAFEVGFNNLSNFNRRFLEQQGVNPRNYRKAFLVKL